jgi:molybdopterin converting factor small subunit
VPEQDPSTDTPARVTVRYWAAAKEAAGVASEPALAVDVGGLAEALQACHPALEPVLRVASFLVDGVATPRSGRLTDGVTVEVLPPFAGG